MILVFFLIFLGAIYLAVASFGAGHEADSGTWDEASVATKSQVDRILMRAARPLVRSRLVNGFLTGDTRTSPMYRSLELKLSGSGTFGRSVEVFIAYQVFCAIVAAAVLLAGLATGAYGLILILVVLIAFIFAAYPYSTLSTAYKKRTDAVTRQLPDFAELLLMPLGSGMGVVPAIDFTANHTSGPVTDEAQLMLQRIRYRQSEADAFLDAGRRLGTPEAQAFFAACMQAHLEGSKLVENLQMQAEYLRNISYQKGREQAKKLPIKLVLIMGAHLIPALLLVSLLPAALNLTRL